jgi:HK97 gp10 family phage protein
MTVQLKGFRELDRALKRLPKGVARKVINSANVSGAGVIRAQARRNLAQKFKDIDESTAETLKQVVTRKTDQTPYSITHAVGALTRIFPVNFFETGTRPHVIKTKDAKGLGSGDNFFGKKVRHPGQRMQPWLRPAFDESKQKVIDKIGARLWAGIKRETSKFK